MKPLDCLARAQGDIEAEFVEFSSKAGGKAGPVDAVEVIGPKVAVSDAPPEHPIGGREDGGSNRNDGLARTTSRLETAEQGAQVGSLDASGAPGGLDEQGLQPGRTLAELG